MIVSNQDAGEITERQAAQDVTEAVLGAMLDEALALTDEIAAVGHARRAFAEPDSQECAVRLRLAARLSRIAAWASLRASSDAERLAIAAKALDGAVSRLDLGDAMEATSALDAELDDCADRVDRLLERARRLDALLSGDVEAVADSMEPSQISPCSAVILPFRRPSATAGEISAETFS